MDLGWVLDKCHQNNTTWPALFKRSWVNADVLCGSEKGDLILARVFWHSFRERPFCRVDVLIVCFPNWVGNSQVSKNAPVHYFNALILMLWIKVEVWTWSNCVLRIRLPNSILELDNWVLDHQIKRQVNLTVHSVDNLDKNLTLIWSLTDTKSFGYVLKL